MTHGHHNTDSLVNIDPIQQTGPQAALVAPNAFYRSKVLSVNNELNPIIGASASLLSVISQCQTLPGTINLTKLQAELMHEIFCFESTVQLAQRYTEKTILAARFALCAFVDETIERALDNRKEDWQTLSLLHRFHGITDGDQQFYVLLDRAMAEPEAYVDLLELFYMCLSLGYQGKFGQNAQGFLIRENIVNRLYQTIQSERGEFSRSVMVGTEQAPPTVTPRRITSKGVLAVSLAAIFTIGSIVIGEFYSVQNANQSVQHAMSQVLHSHLGNSQFTSFPQSR